MADAPILERAVVEVFGGCNYTCQMCPQGNPGRDTSFTRKMPLSLFESILDQIVELGNNPVIQLEGSGEATMAKDLDLYVQACTDRGLRSYLYTNGFRMYGSFMQKVIDAGLDFVRFSMIGYDLDTYRQWMDTNQFEWIIKNIRETKSYVEQSQSQCQISSYHLILDPDRTEYEIQQYRANIIDALGITGYIWKQHNWSGNLDAAYERQGKRRTCGRPFANEITIRAGGLPGHNGAVTPCCQTMGPPNESKSVLGHLDEESLVDVWNGELYEELRRAHREEDFDSIEYCKNCDFLIDDPEVLVWSNDEDIRVHKMLGTSIDLSANAEDS